MTSPDAPRHVEIKEGEQTVAAAEVTTRDDTETARASLHAEAGHVPPGVRASLVDDVMDLPEVRQSKRLEATVPLGDGESLERLRERTDELDTRPAGSTALFDATIPQPDHRRPRPQPRRNPRSSAATRPSSPSSMSSPWIPAGSASLSTFWPPRPATSSVTSLASCRPASTAAWTAPRWSTTRSWRSAEDLRAMLASPDCQPHLTRASELGRSEPALYEVAFTHRVPDVR